jgi:hypothetical protein
MSQDVPTHLNTFHHVLQKKVIFFVQMKIQMNIRIDIGSNAIMMEQVSKVRENKEQQHLKYGT